MAIEIGRGKSEDTRDDVSPSRACRIIGGFSFTLSFWTKERWAKLPSDQKPDSAQQLGDDGWFDLQPTI